MATVSSDVLWEILQKSNSYIIKKDGRLFSTDPFNLANVHTQAFAGIASNSATGVDWKSKSGDPV